MSRSTAPSNDLIGRMSTEWLDNIRAEPAFASSYILLTQRVCTEDLAPTRPLRWIWFAVNCQSALEKFSSWFDIRLVAGAGFSVRLRSNAAADDRHRTAGTRCWPNDQLRAADNCHARAVSVLVLVFQISHLSHARSLTNHPDPGSWSPQ